MKTLQDQYKLIKEGKGHKDVFLKEAKQMFPNYIRNAATFEEASNILKDKNVISENLVGLEPINTISRKKESYETAFENFLEEARKKNDNDPNAEIKKVSQQVEDKLQHNFDRTDKKNPDNQIFGEIMKGYYCEMKDPKNAKKTEQQLRDIVLKNLAKDPIYYTKNGMFGEKGVGVEMDVPGLGEPKEPKGKYKSSGYGDLKEGKIKRNYPNFLDSEYQGETIPMTGDELYTFLVDTMAISRNVDDFIQKVTYGLTDKTSTLSSENEEKLRNWWDKNYNMNESIDESKLRKVINTLIREELDKNYDKNNNILYLNRVKDAIASNGEYEYDEDALSNTLDNPTRAQLLSAVNALDVYNIDLYSLVGKYDEDIINTLEGIFKQVDDEFYSDFTDPAGGSGLASHLQESKLRKVINSMIKQELISENKKYQKTIKEIEKASKLAELTTKMEALDKAIEEKNSRLNSIEESEEMKELVDKKAMKELQKEIKLLEKYKGKVLKMYEKLTKTKKKEVIDEDTVTEAEGDVDDAKTTADELERAADAAKEISDTELFEMEPSKEYLDAKEEAEERYENGEEIEVIVKDFPEFQEMLFQDLKGKYEG